MRYEWERVRPCVVARRGVRRTPNPCDRSVLEQNQVHKVRHQADLHTRRHNAHPTLSPQPSGASPAIQRENRTSNIPIKICTRLEEHVALVVEVRPHELGAAGQVLAHSLTSARMRGVSEADSEAE